MKTRILARARKFRRDRSRPTLTAVVLNVGAALAIIAGVRGLLAPSATVSQAIGTVALILALGYIGSGVTTLLGAWTQSRRVEIVGLIGIASLTLLHGSVIILAAPDTADLTGLRIIGAAFITLAFATSRWERGISRRDIHRIDEIHDDLTGSRS